MKMIINNNLKKVNMVYQEMKLFAIIHQIKIKLMIKMKIINN